MPSRRSPRLSALFGVSYSGGKIFGKWRCNNRILVIMTGGLLSSPQESSVRKWT